MAIGRDSSTGAQDRDEKKDHPRRDGRHRGQEDDDYFTDPQAEQAEGKRTPHSQPGSNQSEQAKSSGSPKQDNTVSGGNRRKGSNQGRIDHN